MPASSTPFAIHQLETPELSMGCWLEGPQDALVVVLLHGFPYDAHAYAHVVPRLLQAGLRVVVPWLRGFGPTRFVSAQTLRSGQQAALAHDVRALLDALDVPHALLAGYDWGGRAACAMAALWPERVKGLVVDGYSIQQIARAQQPQRPEVERRYWYQFYLHGERGRDGLTQYRHELCRQLWQDWSPGWPFSDSDFAQTAAAFDNPDFVEVVVHSYRHRFGLVAGDPALEYLEQQLACQPIITVPTLSVHGGADTVVPPAVSEHERGHFSTDYRRMVLAGVGHNLPQEAPDAFANAILSRMA